MGIRVDSLIIEEKQAAIGRENRIGCWSVQVSASDRWLYDKNSFTYSPI